MNQSHNSSSLPLSPFYWRKTTVFPTHRLFTYLQHVCQYFAGKSSKNSSTSAHYFYWRTHTFVFNRLCLHACLLIHAYRGRKLCIYRQYFNDSRCPLQNCHCTYLWCVPLNYWMWYRDVALQALIYHTRWTLPAIQPTCYSRHKSTSDQNPTGFFCTTQHYN